MVKIENGMMVSFGGLFCIRVPVAVAANGCFNPTLALSFFRKERKKFSVTVKNGKILFQEGKERLTLPCLPPEEMPTIDVLSAPVPVDIDMTEVKRVADVVDPANASTPAAQGLSFRSNLLTGASMSTIAAYYADFPDDFDFVVPKESIVALLKFPGKLTGIAVDRSMVKFCFDNGCSLTSLTIADRLPDSLYALFDGEWDDLSLSAEHAKDLVRLECESFVFRDGEVTYRLSDANASGELGINVGAALSGKITQKNLVTLLKLSHELSVGGQHGRLLAAIRNATCILSLLQYT